MNKSSDQLLTEFATERSEEAFRELVGRYVNLVYSTALRIVSGDASLAEDISQQVFLTLARKAQGLSSKVMLGGWLHQNTWHVAMRTLRSEHRRNIREEQAIAMNALMDDSGAQWRRLAPILDEAIMQLGREDRIAILLRFYEQRDFRSVGEALGSTQDAARVRVNRALEKLHRLLRLRGVTLSAATLAGILATNAVTAAPAALTLAISSTALVGAAAGSGSAAAVAFLKFMAATKLKIGVTALIIAGAATAVIEHRSTRKVRGENESLRQQVAHLQAEREDLSPRPARAVQPANSRVAATNPIAAVSLPDLDPLPKTDLYSLMTNPVAKVKLTTAQVDSYLKENGRTPATLLSAFRTSDNPEFLQEALQNFPDDPQVCFEAALSRENTPAGRRQALDAFKKAVPDNALAYYLSAADNFKNGHRDEAIQDLAAAEGKTQFHDYTAERTQSDQETYRTAGYPIAEANLVAAKQLPMPQLIQAKELGMSLLDLSQSYRQNGDETSSRTAVDMAARLGSQFSNASAGEPIIGRMVGIFVENNALRTLDPSSQYGSAETVQDRMNALNREQTGLQNLARQADPLWKNLSDQDWITYQNRSASLGEEAAMRWLIGKFASQ